MSSTIPYSSTSTGEPYEELESAGIPHFDATARRKERMRQAAANNQRTTAVPPTKTTIGNNGHTASTSATSPHEATTPTPLAQPPSPPKAAPQPPTASRLSGPELEKYLIDFVVEQTGYPPEMVELDADLEADLGIDSIKKAQLFGELANDFEVLPSDDFSLDDFPTLRHVFQLLDTLPQSVDSPIGASATIPAPAEIPAEGLSPSAAPEPIHAQPVPALSGAALEEFLVNFVVEQTGYPPEMVELDADLEADLGIDSIKKAQLFGELANEFNVQASDDLSLDDFPTLHHVKHFLESASSLTAPPNTAAVAESNSGADIATTTTPQSIAANSPSQSVLSGPELDEFLVNFVVEQTGYPPEMVELDADLEADLGIDSIKKAQLFGELANEFNVQASDDLSLDDFPTLRHVKTFLESAQHAAS